MPIAKAAAATENFVVFKIFSSFFGFLFLSVPSASKAVKALGD